jgi:gamma-glutamyltranspeptidase/glutathione hydrolase
MGQLSRRFLGLAVAVWLASHAPSQAADLSPAHWTEAQRNELQARQLAFAPKVTRESRGSVLVTGTSSPIAVHAGMVALRQGGSAADAAAVVALTQIATTMGGTVSYAGKFGLAYFDARKQSVSFLDASWSPYGEEDNPGAIPDLGTTPAKDQIGRQTLVPGFMRGLEALHARYGRLDWAALFQPAIWYAENGVAASPNLIGFREGENDRFERTPQGHAFLRTADGRLPRMGDTIRQPELAKTLRAVARRGASEMYTGAWARDYVETVRAYGGRATLEDLAGYRPRWRPALTARFAGATVFGISEGPLACASLTSLNLADAMHVSEMGPYWKDAAAFRAYARAIQYAELRQFARVDETPFERSSGLAGSSCADRLTKPYTTALAAELLKREPRPFGERRVADAAPGHHTMAVVVVDREGNVAVLVHSSNGEPTGIVVAGVPIPEAATVTKSYLRGLRGGDLVPNDIAPLIALRGGRPVVAVGATALSLMPETVRVVGELLSGRDLATVMAAPPLLYNLKPPQRPEGFGAWPVLAPERAYDDAFLKQLEGMGLSIEAVPRSLAWTNLRGTAAAVLIAPGAASAVEVPVLDYFVESER